MALPQSKSHSLPHAEERRRHQRVRVNLLGRYMLADRREFPCQVVNMSPGGMALIAPVSGNVGDRVIAYVDHLGRLEGHIARTKDGGKRWTYEQVQVDYPLVDPLFRVHQFPDGTAWASGSAGEVVHREAGFDTACAAPFENSRPDGMTSSCSAAACASWSRTRSAACMAALPIMMVTRLE